MFKLPNINGDVMYGCELGPDALAHVCKFILEAFDGGLTDALLFGLADHLGVPHDHIVKFLRERAGTLLLCRHCGGEPRLPDKDYCSMCGWAGNRVKKYPSIKEIE